MLRWRSGGGGFEEFTIYASLTTSIGLIWRTSWPPCKKSDYLLGRINHLRIDPRNRIRRLHHWTYIRPPSNLLKPNFPQKHTLSLQHVKFSTKFTPKYILNIRRWYFYYIFSVHSRKNRSNYSHREFSLKFTPENFLHRATHKYDLNTQIRRKYSRQIRATIRKADHVLRIYVRLFLFN